MLTLEPTVLPFVTFLISTYNRRDVLLGTLAELADVDQTCGFITETIIVDNASTDGTAVQVARKFPNVKLIQLPENRGACAKNLGLKESSGRYIVFLDDDSYPLAGSIRCMVEHFLANRDLGAAVFNVMLPDGSRECSAYPNVFIGCGTGFRREALDAVGALPEDFFMQAEEYDLSLRLLEGGWEVRRFDNLLVKHLKTPGARVASRTTRLDVRNNLMLALRRFPKKWAFKFALDWMRRYYWIASSKGWEHRVAFAQGVVQGWAMSLKPRSRQAVSLSTFERFARIKQIHARFDAIVRETGCTRVLLIDVGKNMLPYYLAAKDSRVKIVAIADPKFAAKNRKYRGIPVVDDESARLLMFDLAVVSNLSPVHAENRAAAWRKITARPVYNFVEEAEALELAA